MSSPENSGKIISGWIAKGDEEKDIFFQFICYWIAFNCLFYTKTDIVDDRPALEKFCKMEDFRSRFEKLAESEDYKDKLKKLAEVCPIKNDKIQDRKREISDINNLEEVFFAIYQIRCNLFHGSKEDTNKRDFEVVSVASPVLRAILGDFMRI